MSWTADKKISVSLDIRRDLEIQHKVVPTSPFKFLVHPKLLLLPFQIPQSAFGHIDLGRSCDGACP